MKLKQMLQTYLEEWASISSLSFCLLDESNEKFITVGTVQVPEESLLMELRQGKELCLFVSSTALYKVIDDSDTVWILIISDLSDPTSKIGELAVCQVRSLLNTLQEKSDKNTFLQNMILGNYSDVECYNLSRKYRISSEETRTVFLVETSRTSTGDSLSTLRNIFGSRSKDLITAIDGQDIVILHEHAPGETESDLHSMAHMLVDMLNTEAMTRAKVSLSAEAAELTVLSNAYREAKTAMEIGKIFYAEQDVFAYDRLGIGRLIYQLPLEICEMFLKESFPNEMPDELDEETLNTIRTFFENNLNLSETSRQLYVHRNTLVYRFERLQKRLGLDIRTFEDAITFKIAMMVSDYLKHQKDF